MLYNRWYFTEENGYAAESEIKREGYIERSFGGSAGEGISSNSIKEFIKEIVDKEDQKSPYSDQDMAEMLQEKGIKISRRTVAKYRDEMHILSSSKRKRY